jgi:hypothetical protein
MSCWVVPSIAAEIWGVSVDHVLEQIRTGAIASRQEYGFTVVDVAPSSAEPPRASRRPATFVTIRRQVPQPAEAPAAALSDAELAALGAEAEGIDYGELDWRRGRVAAAQRRRRPPLSLAA